MHTIDLLVQNYFAISRTGQLTEFMYLVTGFFNVTTFIALAIAFAFLVYLVRGRKYVILFLVTLAIGGLLSVALKYVFNVARPTGGVMTVVSSSFPSGHAFTATIFFTMLMYIFDDYFSKFKRIIFNTLCIGLIFLIAFSRVYLGVHWVSDVLGGIIMGVLVTYISVTVSKRVARKA